MHCRANLVQPLVLPIHTAEILEGNVVRPSAKSSENPATCQPSKYLYKVNCNCLPSFCWLKMSQRKSMLGAFKYKSSCTSSNPRKPQKEGLDLLLDAHAGFMQSSFINISSNQSFCNRPIQMRISM